MSSTRQRIRQQPAWILHSQPWRETSLIIEVFSRDYGRLPLVAKGARRPLSQLRGVLMAFQPLLVDWSGGGEVKNLHHAEWQGGQPMLAGEPLWCAYYLNELLLRLMAREDPHPGVFAVYGEAVAQLARVDASQGLARSREGSELILRRFELALLRELGYGLQLATDVTGMPLQPEGWYVYRAEEGPVDARTLTHEELAVQGRTLLDMASGELASPRSAQQAKRLLRQLLLHHLNGQPLQSRRVFMDVQAL